MAKEEFIVQTKRKNNYCPIDPPPSVEDLLFQTCAFDPRIGGPKVTGNLSPQAHAGLYGDKTLKWNLGDKIRRAGKVLEE